MRRWVAVLFLCVSLIPLGVSGSPESRRLLEQAVEDLGQKRYDAALKKAEAAEKADPKDAQAVFFQGVALNRLGRPEGAYPRLSRAARMGSTHADLDFELGWCLVELRRWKEAAEHLERYEAAQPGRGQTSEFLGRAYFAIGMYDKAETALTDAIRRDPALKPTAGFYLALVEKARKNDPAAGRRLQGIVEDAPDSPVARTLRRYFSRPGAPPAEPAKPWHVAVSLGMGHNTNVVALGDGVTLPSDISSEGSYYGRGTVDMSYDWKTGSRGTVRLGYSFLGEVYENIHSFDLVNHFIYASYRHRLASKWEGSVRVSQEFSKVGGRDYRDQFGVRTAAATRLSDSSVLELSHAVSLGSYHFPTSAALDRDGTAHTVALTDYQRFPGTDLSARFGYFHVWNDADGGDYDYQSNGLTLGLSHPIGSKMTADLIYSRTTTDFDRLNSLVGFARARRDDADALTVQLTRRLTKNIQGFTRFDYLSNGSNISFFRYSQRSIGGGVVVSF